MSEDEYTDTDEELAMANAALRDAEAKLSLMAEAGAELAKTALRYKRLSEAVWLRDLARLPPTIAELNELTRASNALAETVAAIATYRRTKEGA